MPCPVVICKEEIIHEDDILILNKQLERVDQKEARIKEAYRNGIDTLEEYKENKELLLKEKSDILKEIEALTAKEDTNAEDIPNWMRERIQTAYSIVSSDEFSDQQKNEAIRSVVEKIIWHKDEKLAEVFYYYI